MINQMMDRSTPDTNYVAVRFGNVLGSNGSVIPRFREQIAAGKYIIMSSHQMEVVEEFCTDITILHRSKAVVSGNLNEIKKERGRVNLSLKVEQDISSYIK